MTAELKAAIFDFGGVLTTPILDSFASFEQTLGVPQGTLFRAFAHARTEGASDFHRLETGEMTEAEYYRLLGARLEEFHGAPIEWPADPVAVRRGLLGGLRRNEEMIEAVERIHRSYTVGMLTNNVREWGDWRSHYPMDLFDVVVDSSEVGLRKPDPAIYRLTCERLGVLPEECSFVDDIAANVKAAEAVGMHGILFTSTGEVLARLEPLFPKAFERLA